MDRPEARVLLLGPAAIEVAGVTTPITSRQQAGLLAMLALNPGRPVPTAELIDRAWPGNPPASAPAALRVQLARLRTALRAGEGDPLPHTARGYALDPLIVATDLRDLGLIRLLLGDETDPAERLRLTDRALDLWRGEPAFASLDDQELRVEGQRLAEIRLELEDARADALIQVGQHDRACVDLLGLVAAQPLRERRSQQLMLAQYRSGRQADALATFRELRDRLVEELGVEPDPGTAGLELAILRQDPSLLPEAQRAAARSAIDGIPPDPATLRPPTPLLADLLTRRLAPLGADARRLALVAALLDDEATPEVLARALHTTPGEVEALIGQATASLVFGRAPGGAPRWQPELRDALLASADADERAVASHDAGVALGASDAPGALVRAAWLLVRSEAPWSVTGPVVHRALNTLRSIRAAGHGADLCRAAAPLAVDAADRADLLTRHARSLGMAGRPGDADTVWVEAIDAARESGDPERLGLAVVALDWAYRSHEISQELALERFREALDGLGPRPSALRLAVLTSLLQMLSERPHERGPVAELAREVEAQSLDLDDAESLAIVLNNRHTLLRGTAELSRRRRIADALDDAASRTAEVDRWTPRVHNARLLDAMAGGQHALMPDLCAALLASAEQLRSQRLAWQHALIQSCVHRDRGNHAVAGEWAERALVLGLTAGLPVAEPAHSAHTLLTLYLTGSLAEMVPALTAFVDQGPGISLAIAKALRALALAQDGDLHRAAAAVDAELALPREDPPAEWTPVLLGILTDAAGLVGSRAAASDLVARLEPFAGQWLTAMHGLSWGPADRCRGILTAVLGEERPGIGLVAQARRQATLAGAAAWVTRCDLDLARLNLTRSDAPSAGWE